MFFKIKNNIKSIQKYDKMKIVFTLKASKVVKAVLCFGMLESADNAPLI